MGQQICKRRSTSNEASTVTSETPVIRHQGDGSSVPISAGVREGKEKVVGPHDASPQKTAKESKSSCIGPEEMTWDQIDNQNSPPFNKTTTTLETADCPEDKDCLSSGTILNSDVKELTTTQLQLLQKLLKKSGSCPSEPDIKKLSASTKELTEKQWQLLSELLKEKDDLKSENERLKRENERLKMKKLINELKNEELKKKKVPDEKKDVDTREHTDKVDLLGGLEMAELLSEFLECGNTLKMPVERREKLSLLNAASCFYSTECKAKH